MTDQQLQGQNNIQEQQELSEQSSDEELDVFHYQEEKEKYPMLNRLLENVISQLLVNLLTLYALYGDDIRIICFDKRADSTFDGITIFCIIIFSTEIVITSIVRQGYFNSFFFWLDIISTVSQILDITLFNMAVGLEGSVSAKTGSDLSQANKASKTSSKAVRVVRLVRLIRIVKLYKAVNYQKEVDFQKTLTKKLSTVLIKNPNHAQIHPLQNGGGDTPLQNQSREIPHFTTMNGQAVQSKDQLNNMTSVIEGFDQGNSYEQRRSLKQILPENYYFQQQQHNEDIAGKMQEKEHKEQTHKKESRVSKRLSDATTKKVILLVILLLLIMPLFSSDYYFDSSSSLEYAAQYFKVVAEIPNTKISEINETLNFVISQHDQFDTPVGFIRNPFTEIPDYERENYEYLRESAKSYYFKYVDPILVGLNYIGDPIILFVSDNSQIEKLNSIINIVNTLFVSCVLLFGALAFANDAKNVALAPIERMIAKVNVIAKNPQEAKEMKLEVEQLQRETTQIENAIIKIGALLALGFGDAGSAIIGTNMASSGDVNPMLPGKKKLAIYGFCDIRNFTDATEVLQKDVMVFVNSIAEIVHAMVNRYQGSANKNIGDAFLLVWKVSDHSWYEENGKIKWKNYEQINMIADCSLLSFMKIFAKINREPKILEYRNDARLTQRLPGYKVKMGFGLHIGWGIEGAIGSEFKIDASYLSPNVNMASRLEAATKQYGVSLLISSDLYLLFSPGLKKYQRQIDMVTVKGSVRPIGLYTIDIEGDNLPPSKEDYPQEERFQVMDQKRQIFVNQIEAGEFKSENHINRNKDLLLIMKNYNPEFQAQFSQGFQGYLLGNWKEAQMWFERAKLLKPNDGPIATLFSVMGESNFKAPSDWKGYRELTEK
ncbi:unnamed protein product (macronuclear) [Paramecium tetraurelia]|uniref:Guanylate cyclase domain-containing protein n=1 Tax=Paramecium tetraurelia TaxID=5888 RepID=A0DHP1_PARTE|nr:uncharacterized protein GSPATT00016945001 [Paramecium tetraurelia]CAK82558.1 unnamed protein product [Paramecium tetraurelia]|eukprot:XP_001449955.1 hypothetical protein (macronuclear) [Paramecium tetraurelia strain d4-2]